MPNAAALERGVLDQGNLLGDLRQQTNGASHDVVEVHGITEETFDRLALGSTQRLDVGDLIDEESVAAVGGDSTGGGVRVGDVTLVLKRSHVVTDGGRRNSEVVPLDQRLGADGLMGGDVVLHDRSQHGEPAFLEHGTSRSAFWHSLGQSAKSTPKTPASRASRRSNVARGDEVRCAVSTTQQSGIPKPVLWRSVASRQTCSSSVSASETPSNRHVPRTLSTMPRAVGRTAASAMVMGWTRSSRRRNEERTNATAWS